PPLRPPAGGSRSPARPRAAARRSGARAPPPRVWRAAGPRAGPSPARTARTAASTPRGPAGGGPPVPPGARPGRRWGGHYGAAGGTGPWARTDRSARARGDAVDQQPDPRCNPPTPAPLPPARGACVSARATGGAPVDRP